MIKYIFPCIILVALSFISCNNTSDSRATAGNATIPDAEKQLRDAVAKYPDSLLLTENLIQYFRENGNYGQAIIETENAIKRDSSIARLWDIKATLYFENEDTMAAIRSFEKAVEIKADPEYIISLGSLYAQTKNPMALTMADGLLQAPKANAQKQALFIKGIYYSYTGDKARAISFFDNCLALDYTDMLAYREKAICLYDLGKYADALKFLERAVTVQNSFDEGYYWMGRCYEKLNKPTEAKESYQMALQIDPEYIEAKEALRKLQ